MGNLESIFSQTSDVLRLVVSAVLLLSGFGKLLDTADFARVLRGFRTVPSRAVRPLAVSIPALEVIIGSWLALGGQETTAAAVVAGGLVAVFTIVIAGTLVQGRSLECGCFGRVLGGLRATWRTVVRNAILVAMALAVGAWHDATSSHGITGIPALFMVAASVVGTILSVETVRTFRSVPMRRRAGFAPTPTNADTRFEPSWKPKGADEWMGSGSSPI